MVKAAGVGLACPHAGGVCQSPHLHAAGETFEDGWLVEFDRVYGPGKPMGSFGSLVDGTPHGGEEDEHLTPQKEGVSLEILLDRSRLTLYSRFENHGV